METSKPRGFPLPLKLAYTAFLAVLIPIYLRDYGPTNFLYFCDIALLFTLVALWTNSRLLTSIPAAGIVFPQILWCVDFFFGFAGMFPFGLTDYMFDENIPLFARGLSLFHAWLPFLLLYMVHRVGYDRRSFWTWTVIAWAAMVIAYLFLPETKNPDDPNIPFNVNYVFEVPGFSNPLAAQGIPWFYIMLIAIPVVTVLPAHLVLNFIYGKRNAPQP